MLNEKVKKITGIDIITKHHLIQTGIATAKQNDKHFFIIMDCTSQNSFNCYLFNMYQANPTIENFAMRMYNKEFLISNSLLSIFHCSNHLIWH